MKMGKRDEREREMEERREWPNGEGGMVCVRGGERET